MLQKRFYWVYARQTTTKEVVADVDDPTGLGTNVIGASPYEGEAGAAADKIKWALVGEIAAGSLKAIGEDAFIKGEKGDSLPLSGGDNPVISEKLTSELKSFDVKDAAWSTAAEAGSFGSMPLRKRLSSNVTGKNIDLAFIDVRSPLLASGVSTYNIYVWDVPVHVGVEIPAGDAPFFPVTIEKDVSDLADHIDIFICTAP